MHSPVFSEQQNMMQGLGNEQIQTDDHAFYIFQSQLELEKKIEKAKIQLSLKTDFNLIDAFRIFNESGNGSSSISDLQRGLQDLGLDVTHDELSLFMKRFD